MIKRLITLLASLSLAACSNFMETDNTPKPTALVPFTAEMTPHLLWSTNVGSSQPNEHLAFSPTLYGTTLYTASTNGIITATNKQAGHTIWSIRVDAPVTAGPGTNATIVVIGTRQGDVIALDAATGHLRWKNAIPGAILAKPALSQALVIVKAINGMSYALSTTDGHIVWTLRHTEPGLILHGASNPVLQGNALFLAYASGNLTKVSLNNGQVDWTHPVALPEGAFTIQRMVDIDATPVLFRHRLFAATYQGKIASLDWQSGQTHWSRDISTYTGMAVDSDNAYVSDAKGDIWAFGTQNGQVNWRQTQLEARHLSSPAIMDRYLAVGDAEGYLHWLSLRDGHFVAREFVGNAIIGTPVVENHVLYALTTNGSLVAYTLSS